MLTEFYNSEKGVQLCRTILQHIAIYKMEYEMLKKIALSPERYRNIEHKDIPLIDHLEKYGLIDYDKSTFFVTFNIQLVQDYLQKESEKKPEDMNNDERREYVQSKVARCEKKLKQYVLNCYQYSNSESVGRQVLIHHTQINNKVNPRPDVNTCDFKDFFDHHLFILYFSTLKKIIYNNWATFCAGLEFVGIDKERFKMYMEDLNAGRSDADHYDAEDMYCPNDWEIDDDILQKFSIAYSAMNTFFTSRNL